MLAPDDGVGVLAFANRARRGMHWLAPEVGACCGGCSASPTRRSGPMSRITPSSGATCAAGTASPPIRPTRRGSPSAPGPRSWSGVAGSWSVP
jgi:hypothetical protein